jgi:CubicO group peptidase (beta-lactamase class C family)
MSHPPNIEGYCAAGFEPVREALEKNLRDPDELGQAVSIHVEGRPVVDLWGGHRDRERTLPWTEDTWACFFSVGKPIVALACAGALREAGIGLATPVAALWPSYAQAGKALTTVDHVLSHLAGIPGAFAAQPGDAYDWQAMINAIERQAPMWPVGSQGCYHTFTYGHLVGELARIVTGKRIGALVNERIAAPLGLELGFGLSPEQQSRCADVSITHGDPLLGAIRDPTTLIGRCWQALPLASGQEDFNSAPCRAAEMPSFNGHGTARALAKLYSTLSLALDERGETPLFPSGLLRELTQERWSAVDALGLGNRMARGFRLTNDYSPFNRGPRAFGHSGIGGALAFADPDHGLGFGFVTNRLAPGPGSSPYPMRLVDAMRIAMSR